MWLDNLNRIKKNSGMTIEQISEASGVPKGTLNKLLQARQRSSVIHRFRRGSLHGVYSR